jgi:hypothetical protein
VVEQQAESSEEVEQHESAPSEVEQHASFDSILISFRSDISISLNQ